MPKLPRFVHPALAAVTALVFFWMLKRERQGVAANLRQVVGSGGAYLYWKVYRVFYSFCDLMVSYCFVPGASHAQLLSMLVDGDAASTRIEDCLAEGKGVIVWTAHVGNPEFAARLLELHGRPVNVARVVEDNPAEIFLRDRMANEQLRIVDLRAGASASIELLQALRRNEIVAIQGDRVYHPRHSASVQLFGREALFPLGPFLLACVSGAPILPGFVVRESWLRYRVLVGDPIRMEPLAEDGVAQRKALGEAVQLLEQTLAVYYDQWLNFFPFWPVQIRE
jgi:KDO2-lipid IV(A) lauroyltransferase